jgi:hypothetical protein
MEQTVRRPGPVAGAMVTVVSAEGHVSESDFWRFFNALSMGYKLSIFLLVMIYFCFPMGCN